MNITILKEFADLAHTLNFRKTAERMYISQPSLSKHIMTLEKELDVQLFWRTKNSVILTPEGGAILPHVIRILDSYAELQKVTNTWNRKIQGKLRIGYLDLAVRNTLSRSISAYREQYPDMEISLWSCQMGELLNALRNNGVDLGICLRFRNMHIPPEVTFVKLMQDQVGAVLPKGHPLTECETIRFDDVLNYPVILPSYTEFTDYAQLIREQFERSVLKPVKTYEYEHIDTVQLMVESGIGLAMLPRHIAMYAHDVEFRLIEDFHIDLDIGIYRRRDNHTIGQDEFIAVMKAVIGSGLMF